MTNERPNLLQLRKGFTAIVDNHYRMLWVSQRGTHFDSCISLEYVTELTFDEECGAVRLSGSAPLYISLPATMLSAKHLAQMIGARFEVTEQLSSKEKAEIDKMVEDDMREMGVDNVRPRSARRTK